MPDPPTETFDSIESDDRVDGTYTRDDGSETEFSGTVITREDFADAPNVTHHDVFIRVDDADYQLRLTVDDKTPDTIKVREGRVPEDSHVRVSLASAYELDWEEQDEVVSLSIDETPHATFRLGYQEWTEVLKHVLEFTLGPPIEWTYDNSFVRLWGDQLDDSLLMDISDACSSRGRELSNDGSHDGAMDAERVTSQIHRADRNWK